eukprot:TRINITY_DN8261_c1_g1_i4.p1 TRINITY_DN8261_c1_g1~~TRINITY_DN8261_c1_g1_i4.p1  ORF type:complete len:741 (+),score=112.23 TRINITY_DN8261_c1_g1_i4:64-2223(+)
MAGDFRQALGIGVGAAWTTTADARPGPQRPQGAPSNLSRPRPRSANVVGAVVPVPKARPSTAGRSAPSARSAQQQLQRKHTQQLKLLDDLQEERRQAASSRPAGGARPGQLASLPQQVQHAQPSRPRSAMAGSNVKRWTAAAAGEAAAPARPRSANATTARGGHVYPCDCVPQARHPSAKRPQSAGGVVGSTSAAAMAGRLAQRPRSATAGTLISAAGGGAPQWPSGRPVKPLNRFTRLMAAANEGLGERMATAAAWAESAKLEALERRSSSTLPFITSMPEELLIRACRATSSKEFVELSACCTLLRNLMRGIVKEVLSDIYTVDCGRDDGTGKSFRQLHMLERMNGLSCSTMAVFKRPIVLVGVKGTAGAANRWKVESGTQLMPSVGSLPDSSATVLSVACGRRHLVFLDSMGRAWSMGDPRAAGISLGRTQELREPELIHAFSGVRLVKAACGNDHTIAMSATGDLYTWGRALNRDDNVPWLLPDPAAGLAGEAVDVAAGETHVAAASLTGDTYAWGQNHHGQCALEPSCTYVSSPSRAGGNIPGNRLALAVARQVACGRYHTAVLTSTGEVFTFGATVSGQLGRATVYPAAPAWQPGVASFSALDDEAASSKKSSCGPSVSIIQVACGDEHTLCLSDTGRVFAFGNGDYGQLGMGGVRSYRTPVLLRTMTRISEITAGGNWSLLRERTGKVHLAGRGDDDPDGDCRLLRQLVGPR